MVNWFKGKLRGYESWKNAIIFLQVEFTSSEEKIDRFHKWQHILLFLCIYVKLDLLVDHFALNILLNFAHDSEANKDYLH